MWPDKRIDLGQGIYYDRGEVFAKEGKVMNRRRVSSKKKKADNIYGDIQSFLGESLDFLVCIYMLLLVVGLPFYFTDGYTRIGTNKYEFFYYVSVGATGLLLPLAMVYQAVSRHRKGQRENSRESVFARFCVTDWFALGYGVAVLLSYFFSEYKESGAYGDVWKGTTGWFMGACSQLMFVGIYFAVSRFWRVRKWLPALWLPVSFVVFGLGILNRFGIRPIEMENASKEFISTIGNINWYCGYLVVLVFGMLYYFWTNAEKKPGVRAVSALCLIMGFASLVTQGSRSGILALVAAFACLYLLSMKSADKLERFFLCGICFGAACTGIYILRRFFGERYNYNDMLWNYFTNHWSAVIILVVSALAWLLLKLLNRKKKVPVRFFTGLGYAGCGLAAVCLVAYVVMLVINTRNPGSIGALSEKAWFTFHYSWGSNRGVTWMAAWQCFADRDLWGKLVGIGPDAMVMYINSGKNAKLLQMVQEVFGYLNLTNAHNEWLTILVNEGLFGLVTYAGIMVSAIVRFLKGGKTSAPAGACGMAALAYTANHLFSFQQTMATATMFLVLGMGEACLRGVYVKERKS